MSKVITMRLMEDRIQFDSATAMAVARYHGETGHVSGLIVAVGPKWVRFIPVEASGGAGLRVKRVPTASGARFKPLLYHGEPYPVRRAAQKLRKCAKLWGATLEARRYIKEALE